MNMTEAPDPILTSRLAHAFAFASSVHATQVRKGTSIPYLSHLMAACSLVIEHGGSEDAAIAALLHDAAEDAGGHPMLARIRAEFGEKVASIVAACTDTFDNPKPPWLLRKERYIAHLMELQDAEALLVSAADKVHNARAILHDLHAVLEPESVWGRFSASPQSIGWYYGSLERALRRGLPDHRGSALADELTRALDAIARVPGSEFESGLRAGRMGESCPQ
jgi:hypothetical protein